MQFCQDKQMLSNKLLFSVRVGTFSIDGHYTIDFPLHPPMRIYEIHYWEVKGLGRFVKTPQVDCRHSLDVR